MNRATPKVAVVGSLNIDLVCHATRRPDKGETIIGDAFDIFTGGKGFNQATAAARLGAEVTLIGSVGADPFGEMLLAAVENEGMNSRFVTRRTDIGTGVATIVVEPDGDNSIIVVPARQYGTHNKRYRRCRRLYRRGGCASPTIGDADCDI